MTLSFIAIDRYVRAKQIALARDIAMRRKVFLDTRFWIIARNVVQDEGASAEERQLLHLLRSGVANGQLICPVSDSIIIEVLDQTPSTTRRTATARVIDELSLGVSLVEGEMRAATEIAHFFHLALGEHQLSELQELVWTKVGHALGYRHPVVEGLDAASELLMQQEVFDLQWDMSLADIVEKVGIEPLPRKDRDEFERDAANVDEQNRAHQSAMKSYQQTYRDEIAGAADIRCDLAAGVIADQTQRAGHQPPTKGSPEWAAAARWCRNLLVAAFDKPDTKCHLMNMHIHASMHAALRWNRGTKFKANHMLDFEHASGALAYCDAFFTEGFMAKIANDHHTKLSDLNGCQTTSSVSEAIAILHSLAKPTDSKSG